MTWIDITHTHVSGIGRQQSAQDANEGRFARAVGTEQAEDLAPWHRQRDVVQGAEVAGVAADVLDVDAEQPEVAHGFPERPAGFAARRTTALMPALNGASPPAWGSGRIRTANTRS